VANGSVHGCENLSSYCCSSEHVKLTHAFRFQIRNPESSLCIDTLGEKGSKIDRVGLYACHGMGGNQVSGYFPLFMHYRCAICFYILDTVLRAELQVLLLMNLVLLDSDWMLKTTFFLKAESCLELKTLRQQKSAYCEQAVGKRGPLAWEAQTLYLRLTCISYFNSFLFLPWRIKQFFWHCVIFFILFRVALFLFTKRIYSLSKIDCQFAK